MNKKRVRPIALGIFRWGDYIFVTKGYDPVKDQVFYRPLGGTIEFGERGMDTVSRELKEENGADVAGLRCVATFENIFTYAGKPGHEIVLLYEGKFVDPSWYERELEAGLEETDDPPLMQGVWMRVDDFGPDAPLYPDGLQVTISSHPSENEAT